MGKWEGQRLKASRQAIQQSTFTLSRVSEDTVARGRDREEEASVSAALSINQGKGSESN